MEPTVGRRMTEDDYFELLETTGERLEYWDGLVGGSVGGTDEHCEIESQLFGELFLRLRGTDCAVRTPHQPIYVAVRDETFFADMSVICGKPEYVDHSGVRCLTNSSVVVEVVSQGTSMQDEGDKFHAYTVLKSVRDYLIVSAVEYSVKVHSRSSADEKWRTRIYRELDEEFKLKSCGVRMRVRDAYGPRVTFAP